MKLLTQYRARRHRRQVAKQNRADVMASASGRKPGQANLDRILATHFDSAATHDQNRARWANTDGLSAAAANSHDVRATQRNRSRAECDNNAELRGQIKALARDQIGKGPAPRFQTGNVEANKHLKKRWRKWAKAVRFAHKLRVMRTAKAKDGEAFAVLYNDRQLLRTQEAELNFRLFECDHFTTPYAQQREIGNAVDGIEHDENGHPKAYHFLARHPGDNLAGYVATAEILPAAIVLHWFDEDRPGQVRGIAETQSGLESMSMVRQCSSAILKAIETAADLALVLETDVPFVDEANIPAFTAFDMPHRASLHLPGGTKANQLKPEHPSTSYKEFSSGQVATAGRALGQPRSVATGSAEGYNFSSAQKDGQDWEREANCNRDGCESAVCDPLMRAFLDELALIPGGLPPGIEKVIDVSWSWIWETRRHADPSKEASSTDKLYRLGLLSDSDVLLARGIDPDEFYEDLAEQHRRRAEAAPAPGPSNTPPAMPGQAPTAQLDDLAANVETLASAEADS